jgi:hypothetical protein
LTYNLTKWLQGFRRAPGEGLAKLFLEEPRNTSKMLIFRHNSGGGGSKLQNVSKDYSGGKRVKDGLCSSKESA